MLDVEQAALSARRASRLVGTLSTASKNALLEELAVGLERGREQVLRANAADLAAAQIAGLPTPKMQRLRLTEQSIAQLVAGVRQIAALPDPVGQITAERTVPSGLLVRRIRAPLGVIAMIYEARPGVTIDAFALCFKAGNACLLKGGKEAARSNAALEAIARAALAKRELPTGAMTAISAVDRDALIELLQLDQHIDLVIPRGGADLIRFVAEHSRIPTIQHYQGVCHVYVDRAADLDMATRISVSAKSSAPATCNAAECVLVHRDVANAFVPAALDAFHAAGVQVRGDAATQAIAQAAAQPAGFALAHPALIPAHPHDFGKEFLDLVVAMAVVDSLDAAVDHIHRFGSNHTEAIITADPRVAEEFCRRVQSSCVVVNASTRFNDGFQLGLGAEIGISTSKLHAYGPMGLEELTTQRYVVHGTGQTR